MRNTLVQFLCEYFSREKNAWFLTGDLGYGAFEPLQKAFPERFIDCGIAEQNMAAVAAGLALKGKRVFVYSIGNFSTMRCLEQIRNDVCYHRLPVTVITVGAGVEYGPLGITHHATEDVAVMAVIPEMRVYAPFNKASCRKALEDICAGDLPAYLRLNKSGYEGYDGCEDLFAEEIAAGEKTAVFAMGSIVEEAVKARELSKEPFGVYAVTSLKPANEDKLAAILSRYQKAITLEEHSVTGGLGSLIEHVVAERGLNVQVKKLGVQNTFTCVVGKREYLRGVYEMNAEAVIKEVEK